MPTPMVIVTCDAIDRDALVWSGAPASYLGALAFCGLLPVQLPVIAEPLDPTPLLDVAAGLLVTGARSNVHPPLYGQPESAAAEPYDHRRDRATLPLIRAAIARGLPLLAICRGIQELNVALGGTLHAAVHDVPGRHDHRSEPQPDLDARFGLRHEVSITPSGVLASVLGGGSVRVNSVHGQAIDRLADELVVEAVAPDGTIEAVRCPGARAFTLGVQWHPEHFVRSDMPSRAIFQAFADACRTYAGERIDVAA